MNQPLGGYLYLMLAVSVFTALLSAGYKNQFAISGRISEYYCFIGSLLFSISTFVYFVLFLLKPSADLRWISYTLFLIIPLLILNVGIAIRAIYYKWDRVKLSERLRLIFGMPENMKYFAKPLPRTDLIVSGTLGYTISLVFSVIYGSNDVLLAIMATLSELFLVLAPLSLHTPFGRIGKERN